MILKDLLKKLTHVDFMGKINSTITVVLNLNDDLDNIEAIRWISEKNIDKITQINCGSIICPSNLDRRKLNKNVNYIFSHNPRNTFSELVALFSNDDTSCLIEFKGSWLDKELTLPKTVLLGKNVVIEKGVEIGENVNIGHNTVVKSKTIIGNNVLIGCNCTIGNVGFGYEKNESGEFKFIPHIGNVVIKDNVEIGNNTCIDRAVLGSTIIGNNVKIDNLVHIAHGVKIEDNSLIIANSMIAGSVSIGKNCWISPSSTIKNGVNIKNNALIGLGAVVLKDVEDDKIIIGNPGRVLNKD
ncbi:MAG: hypothetical protein KF732_06020 [Flavobacteriales bacterium]|nr:hypothetical protein [Flavobacteriales bacterium]